ncbi:hypothetical protein [Stenotrophomonas sp. RAC2]|uniref:hypothetical protein n=1 Tax=Stenotrophomonas sp. RAC2 TaxID=3064902 RepID=UPI0027278B56|nr:hypothetical protein [Stenotrophomonas sp. RAC2]MDV9043246.1 hypothetical protein [Stenotrophomonas sp. RAC2]
MSSKFAAKGLSVAANEVLLLKAGSHARVTSGPLTVCSYWIARISPPAGKTSHYLLAHFSNLSTAWEMKRRIDAMLVEQNLKNHTIQTIAIRTAPDTSVPDEYVDTLDIALDTSMHFTKSDQSNERMLVEKGEGAGWLTTVCTVDFTPDSDPVVPKYKGMYERVRDAMFGPGNAL